MNYIIYYKIAYRDKENNICDSHHLYVSGQDYKVDEEVAKGIIALHADKIINLGYKSTFTDKEKGTVNISYRSAHNMR